METVINGKNHRYTVAKGKRRCYTMRKLLNCLKNSVLSSLIKSIAFMEIKETGQHIVVVYLSSNSVSAQDLYNPVCQVEFIVKERRPASSQLCSRSICCYFSVALPPCFPPRRHPPLTDHLQRVSYGKRFVTYRRGSWTGTRSNKNKLSFMSTGSDVSLPAKTSAEPIVCCFKRNSMTLQFIRNAVNPGGLLTFRPAVAHMKNLAWEGCESAVDMGPQEEYKCL